MNDKSQFKNLIFEGGGVKGIAYAGALMALEELGILANIRRVGGTSAGAITATLLAAGGDGKYVEQAVGGTKFRKFMDDSFGIVRDTKRLLSAFGWGIDFERCVRCGRQALPAQSASVDAVRGGLICRSCGGARLRISAGARERMARAAGGEAGVLNGDEAQPALSIVEAALGAHAGIE